MIASVMLMVVPTLLVGLLPTYETIGIAAPATLILLRLLQGLAVGGEYTTSMVLLVEEALPSRCGRLGSYAPLGSIGGLLLGSLVGAAITSVLPPETAGSWGWRAAFLTGVAIGGPVILARRRLPKEAEVKATSAEMSPIRDAFRTQWTTIVKMIGFNLVNGVGFYMCFIYMTTWLLQTHGFSESKALALDSFALIVLLAGLASFGLIVACFAGACPAFMVEGFPKHVRCSGLSVGYNLSLSIFGGTVPLFSVALIAATSDRLAPAFYLMAAAALSFVMAALINAHPDGARAGW